ncbi:MAG: wax ester/triacylglycerol synthase domain-containing protein, partial [Ilumatobacteraceae bacterium]
IHARPLDLSRPPWELYLIGGLDGIGHVPKGSMAVFLRVHHAAIDGVAGAEILTAIHTHEPDAPPPAPAAGYEWEPDPIPSDAELLRRAAIHGMMRPAAVMSAFRNAAMQMPMLARDSRNPSFTSPASLPQGTRFNQPVGPHRVVGTCYTTIDTLKGIRKGMPEAKINDIGVAVIGGAIRTYLLDKDELPNESLLAMMPISIRPTMTQKADASMPTGSADSKSAATAGNQFALAPITLATDEADPFERLRRIVTSTSHVKESGAYPVRSLMAMTEEALGGLSGTVQRTAVRALSRRGRTLAVHTLVSNVPGPLTPMYFCGAKMVDLTGLGPVLDGMALNNGIGSYGDRVIFCFTADRDALPDPEFYEECIAGAIDDLVAAAQAQS